MAPLNIMEPEWGTAHRQKRYGWAGACGPPCKDVRMGTRKEVIIKQFLLSGSSARKVQVPCRDGCLWSRIPRPKFRQIISITQLNSEYFLCYVDNECQHFLDLSSKQHVTPVVLNLFAEGSHVQTYIFVRGPHWKNFHTSQLTRFVLLQTKVLHKVLEELLKYCWGPHKRCLGAASVSQNSGWEPTCYTVSIGWFRLET